ncbi:MFS transporter [Trinickia caryophylli]|uniref:Predicted arabinose efflux permease, MFS family n=1 Tax=Trinickia caryophylli TaxID=28094 RepID=A0A1X7DHX3_TRICW|nr:MFS transporter [Trinickia caryophylli]PMS12319.1 MFS transporter [Trinickia caryophylli]TRX17008.1 MFS transporter [Trinickia caryophylli]WQE12252.1 MFS transporter [Trinickia caryophylli]SMF15686.1 Predicted arabinose efflux permease, MFS family [Trinickia caryophylli]GLU31606.1 MFS transporter [Trinickia caryophylli]
MLKWFTQLSKPEKRTFWACFSGWGLDAMDTQMYALAIPTLIALWGMSRGEAGLLGTTVLMMAALGGWAAGILADRYGRVRILQLTIAWFSFFTLLSAFTDSFWQLMFTRSLQGLGFGGEWAVGAVLISETISPNVRGRVVGALQAGWAVGYAIAVLLSTLLFNYVEPAWAWRVLFGLGVLPAILVIWIRRNIEEAPVFAKARSAAAADAGKVRILEVFTGPQRTTTLKAILLTFGIYGGNYVMITWLPAYLKMALHLSISNVGGYLVVNILGSFAGAFLNGWMADAFGRRRTFMIIACCQAIAVSVYTLAPIDLRMTLALGFVLGTLQSGTAAGTGAYIAELFPTRIRGSAQGLCGNAGRAIGAIMPTMVGVLSAKLDLAAAMGLCAGVSYLLVVVAAWILPETRGRDLSADVVADAVADAGTSGAKQLAPEPDAATLARGERPSAR